MNDITPYADLDAIEFADNPEPRCAVVLLLDVSGSMQGRRIDELNVGLQTFERALKKDPLASLRVELAVVAFGGRAARVLDVRQGQGEAIPAESSLAFVTVDGFHPPLLVADGSTPMGEAARIGLQLIRDRKATYKQNGIDYFRPWLFLITDGKPTDSGWEAAAAELAQEEAARGLSVYGVGVEGADLRCLARFATQRPPLKLKGLAFEELFVWLSKSLSAVSQSRPGDQAPLPPVGWGTVDTANG
ncbi:MAG: VWA domain-containing protein [Ardenticatenia bacterium]|nr:VWA domain-containing protein [Ardenticatenia bacterium]